MDTQRAKFVAEIHQYEEAIQKTDSVYLKLDYKKKIRKMKRELKEYDRYHNGCSSCT